MSDLTEILDRATALLFDFDGVLVDSEPMHYEAYRIVFERHGHAIDQTEYWRHWTDLGEGAPGEIARHALDHLDPTAIVAEKKVIFDSWVAEGRIPFTPGALELLGRVSASTLPAIVASNTAADVIRTQFATHGIDDPPLSIVGAREGLRKKPFPDIFLEAARQLGVDPAGSLVLEDARKGVEAAVAAAMEVVVVRGAANEGFIYPEAVGETAGLEPMVQALGGSRHHVGG